MTGSARSGSGDDIAALKDRVFPPEQRRPVGATGLLVTAACAGLTLWTLYMGLAGTVGPIMTRAIHLAVVIPLVLLLYPARRGAPGSRGPGPLDFALATLALTAFAWAAFSAERYAWRMAYFDPIPTIDLVAGIAAILLVLEAVRRTVGWTVVLLAAFFIVYALTGHDWPGLFEHKGVPFARLVEHAFLIPEGVFNIIMGIAATFLFTFLAFGAFLQVVGGDRFFMDLATAIAGRRRGGPAKVAVVASAFMGMLSGSTVSNVVTTGSITIPLMKRIGFRPHDAAAFETTASVGGALTPPLMGAGIFLMTQFSGVPLTTILAYSVVPAVIYFASLYFYADIRARRFGLSGLPEAEVPSLRETLKRGWHLAIPLLVLVLLLVAGFTPFFASTAATLLLAAVSYLRPGTRMSWRQLLVALEAAGRATLFISSLLAAASLVFGAITITGLIVKATSIILAYSAGSLVLALILVALMSYVLGMGLPITASYVIVATLGASALGELGLPVLAAHLIIFWLAQDSTITPPICMTAFVAAGIARARPMRTGFESMLVGKALYIVPVMFAFGSLLSDSPLEVAFDGVALVAAMAMTPMAVEGYWLRRMTGTERALAGVAALCLMISALGPLADGMGWFGAGAALMLSVFLTQRRQATAA